MSVTSCWRCLTLALITTPSPQPIQPPRCYAPTPFRAENSFHGEFLAVLHVASMVHRALWLMVTSGEESEGGAPRGTGSILDKPLPKALGPEARQIIDEMGDEAVAALAVRGGGRGSAGWLLEEQGSVIGRSRQQSSVLPPPHPPPPAPCPPPVQEMSAALPASRGPRATAVSPAHVERYAALCEQLYRMSLALHGPGAQPAKGASRALAGVKVVKPKNAVQARWQAAVTRQCEINAAKRGAPGALGELVGGMLQRGDVDATRWCATLLLLQQLGVGLWRLNDCMGERRPGGGCGLVRHLS